MLLLVRSVTINMQPAPAPFSHANHQPSSGTWLGPAKRGDAPSHDGAELRCSHRLDIPTSRTRHTRRCSGRARRLGLRCNAQHATAAPALGDRPPPAKPSSCPRLPPPSARSLLRQPAAVVAVSPPPERHAAAPRACSHPPRHPPRLPPQKHHIDADTAPTWPPPSRPRVPRA